MRNLYFGKTCLRVLLILTLFSPSLVVAQARKSAGNRLLAEAALKLAAQPALEAKVRQRSELFNLHMQGTGNYRQLGANSNMARFELKLSSGGQQVSSLLQVCDGQYLYTYRAHPNQITLSQINLNKVRQAVERAESQPVQMGAWMALGGLSNMLRGLEQNFQFEKPQAILYRNVPVWILKGTWKEEVLRRMIPNQTAGKKPDLNRLPRQMPHHVIITLGRDELFPLFPYRIEYLQLPEKGKAAAQANVARDVPRTVMTLELYAVHHRADLTPEFFQYKPGDQEVIDRTDQFISSLGLKQSSR